MKEDFHYYCIAVLARGAGFPPGDALTIAYASQYVDDATECEPISMDGVQFDPVRTAHAGLGAFDWAVQKRVFIPFHFIPPKPVTLPSDTFVSAPGSEFAAGVVDEALKERKKTLRLCRIGVALHAYADTWSHQGFSGRKNHENDVEGIHLWEKGGWNHLLWANIGLDAMPWIGHIQAGGFPDLGHLRWKYTNDSTGEVVERSNTEEFLKASKAIYDKLHKATKTTSVKAIPWKTLEPDIHALLKSTSDGQDLLDAWKAKFADLFAPEPLGYDRTAWRQEALDAASAQDVDWDDFEPDDFAALAFAPKASFFDSRWVQFHRAALKQRHYVLEHLV